jgi:DNA polymerase (family 10)
MDLADETLGQLDVVVASIHSFMQMDRNEMTERILAAIENPYVQIIAHPTGRLLLRREAFEYEMEKILDAAKKHGVAMECNAYPDRLDLKDIHLRMCKERGVKVVISTDAHSSTHFKMMKYGVITARRGWLEKKDVINTLGTAEFLAALRPRPGAVSAPTALPTKAAKKKSA